MLVFMIIPTFVSLFLAFQVRNITQDDMAANEPQIVCFDPDVCAIEVLGKWYRISGIIQMDETIPEEYLLHDLIEEAEHARGEERNPVVVAE